MTQRLGKYEIQRELGRGAFGTVYLARDTVLDVPRALKMLHPALIVDGTMVERFHREARLAARLEHPHIVPVYDFGQAEGRFYLAMRYMEGGSLKERLAQGPLPWEEVVRIVHDVAAGLAYAHEQGVVHRDLKPGNILFDKDGRVVVTDFGLAKALRGHESSTDLSGSHSIIGTPAYIAPELWQRKEVSPAADQYALACVVYEMVTGQVLFGGDTPWEVMGRHKEGPRFPVQWPKGVPTGVEGVLRKALAQAPEARYKDIRAFAAALGAVAKERRRWGKRQTAGSQSEPARSWLEADRSSAQPASPSSEIQPAFRTSVAEVSPQPKSQLRKGVIFLVGLVALLGGVVGGLVWGIRQKSATIPVLALTFTPEITATRGPTGVPAFMPTRTPALTPTPGATPTITPTFAPTPFVGPVRMGTPYPTPASPITAANAGQVVPLARWGKGQIEQVAYSPDGRLLAVASSIGVYLYDAQNLEEVRFLGTGAWVNSVTFSQDGETLAAGLGDNTVQLWQVSDGTLLRTLKGHTESVNSVAFSPDGKMLASGSDDNTVRLWQVSDGALLRTLKGHTGGVNSVAFSPDGKMLASGSDDNTVRLWQVSDGALLYILEGHSVAFSPDGKMLASASGNTVRLWQVSDGALLRTLEGHTNSVTSVAFSPDGALLLSISGCCGNSDAIWLWRVSDGTLVHTSEGSTDNVTSAAFSPDGKTLASVSRNHTIRLWQVSDWRLSRILERHVEGVNSVVFSPNGQMLALGSWSHVQLRQVSNGALLHTLEGDTTSVAFSPDGEMLASASSNTVRLWQVSDGTLLRALVAHTTVVESIAFSPDGRLLASGSRGGLVRLWRVNDWQPLRAWECMTWHVNSIAFSPDGQILAEGSWSHAQLSQVSDGALLRTLSIDWVRSVAFSPDGEILATGTEDDMVQLWRVSDGTLLRTLEGHTSDVTSVAFSPDGTLLASGSYDGTVRLWRVSDGKLLRALGGQTGGVTSVAFSPDGTLLASGSYDGTIRLWGVQP